MSVIELSGEAMNGLLALPETGAGFQLVSARFKGTRTPFLVLNAEQALDLSDLPDFSGPGAAALIGLWIRQELASPISFFVAPALTEFELLTTRIPAQSVPATNLTSTAALSPPSSLVKSLVLSHPRRFHRFSPFNPDRRVSPTTGDFSPGTYACPESEVPFVPTGFAAVGRFALPSRLPASHHYVVEADTFTPVLFGTVAPAFGQAGGGVEALLQSGATNVASPKVSPALIPDE